MVVFSEVNASHRSFRPEEEKLFANSTQKIYKEFRDKAACSRSLSEDKMEEIAQGRVWTGNDAASRGLVDAIGGFSRAVAIAKHKANIPQDKKCDLFTHMKMWREISLLAESKPVIASMSDVAASGGYYMAMAAHTIVSENLSITGSIGVVRRKKKEEIETFINEGVYHIEKLKEGGWITDIKYDDEVRSMLKTRLGIAEKKKLPLVAYKKYSKVGKSTLGLSGGKDKIAVIRASGGINRVEGSFFSPSSGIVAEKFIEKIRKVRESKRYKAVIIRIDSPGGDALASDFGGYYMAMAAHTIVSENLSITGSIGVVRSKFNFGKLYEKIGFNKEVISKGQFSEDKKVTLVELSKPSLSFKKILFSVGISAIGLKQLQDGLASSDGVQACMDENMFQGTEGSSFTDLILYMLKDYITAV
nr:serine protease SPPA, chloroplastic [Tanacetum cinerariifolium]